LVLHQEYFKQKINSNFTSVKKLQKLQIVTKLGEKVTKKHLKIFKKIIKTFKKTFKKHLKNI